MADAAARELEISAAARRERDLDRAWVIHDPTRARIPHAARQAATAFREGLADGAARVKAAYESPAFRRVLNDWAAKKNIGRAVALSKIKKMMAPGTVQDTGDALLIVWLQPHAGFVQIDMPTFQQPGVIVVGSHVARVRRNIRETGFPVA